MRPSAILIFCLVMVCPAAFAATIQSGPQRVSLVELYSSEGCSSCPLADNWMNSLRGNKRLWKEFVPVVFHVDFWDYLGWKDVYAKPLFTQRQREYDKAWNNPGMYTPGFVLNGRNWKAGPFRSIPRPGKETVGTLAVEHRSGDDFKVVFQPSGMFTGDGPWTAHLALLLFDIRSVVTRGENAGKTLEHDFVAAEYASSEMNEAQGRHSASLKLPAGKAWALAAWITRGSDLEPIQAAGGYLEH